MHACGFDTIKKFSFIGICQPHFMIACDIIARGYFCGLGAEINCGIDICMVAVDDISRYNDDIGRMVGYQ